MIEILRSETFDRWLRELRDPVGVARINARLRKVSLGHMGDVKALEQGVCELRVFHGPGYRIYFLRPDERTVVLLCGGDKSSQKRDIQRAKRLAREWRR
ncbi:type II toxin-antitoxin system RelE/ParE family toxin [Deferrisoma palaeochoriense]